jgi:hypothetical protein
VRKAWQEYRWQKLGYLAAPEEFEQLGSRNGGDGAVQDE